MGILLFLQIFIAVCIFIIGTLFGSFLSLATYRIPRHEDIIATRSYCPNCKHRLGFFDLIPVLSYLIRGAKCKYCKEKISPRYFLLETMNGIIFVILYMFLGYTIQFAIVALVYVLIVLFVGSYIMKSKMTENEKKEVEKLNNNKKLSKKSGVFISELVVALLLFITLMVTSFVMTRNSNASLKENKIRADANFLAVQNLEYCLATDYDKLDSYTTQQKKNDITYSVTANISKLADQDFSKQDLVKVIEVKITYMINGNEKEVGMKTLKGKVQNYE